MKIRNLFLIDGVGAFVSTIFLGVILPLFEDLHGLPKNVLYFLAVFPFLFLIYDLIVLFKIKNPTTNLLRGIAFLNLAYCIISIVSISQHFKSLTFWGILYFVLEVIIVTVLVFFEFKVASKHDN